MGHFWSMFGSGTTTATYRCNCCQYSQTNADFMEIILPFPQERLSISLNDLLNCDFGTEHMDTRLCKNCGPEGRPNNLPQPALRLAELFFWSDLSWLRADLCANSYVISTRFSLLSTLPSCTRYIFYVGILRIIHNVLFRIIRLYDNELGPTDFQPTCYCSYFLIFE